MSVKVSVIIPVYNAEAYLIPCIESLLRQTLKACEFIFINDGSKDNSAAVIESYRKKDGRIKLISQENQGVSAARNAGLQEASGEYIGFVDADDYIDPDMYETLYGAAKLGDCDVVISNFESEMEGRKLITQYPFSVGSVLDKDYIEQEILPYFLKKDDLNSVCNKLFKAGLIQTNRIQFPKKVALGEDGLFNIQFLSFAARVKFIDYVGYHYREVAGSATRNAAGKDYFKRALEVYDLELPEAYMGKVSQVKVRELKSMKLINSVISYIYLYFTPTKEVSFSKRYTYVKNMIVHPYVRESLPLYYNESRKHLGRYEKFILHMIRQKSALALYFAATYSRFRNQ